ncbi:hypothetical protein [uncultured Meiothermus sp.]|jgi:ABC-type multidrug transport system permease subunit|uniref:hypothetical protein n=1 Tax=uncultured Meiothermus sp. TaxID=157471 RepID=UPI002606A19A|nr:hypothetical protein [uncultured Meiothermus sp.]
MAGSMNRGGSFRWLVQRNLRYAAYTLAFGLVWEGLWRLLGHPYGVEVPFLVLALVGSILALYLAWFTRQSARNKL